MPTVGPRGCIISVPDHDPLSAMTSTSSGDCNARRCARVLRDKPDPSFNCPPFGERRPQRLWFPGTHVTFQPNFNRADRAADPSGELLRRLKARNAQPGLAFHIPEEVMGPWIERFQKPDVYDLQRRN